FIARMIGRLWRWPISKSVGSWPGVTLTAPVPNSGSTTSSATIGISRPMCGTTAVRPTIAAERSSVGLTAMAVSPSTVSGRVVASQALFGKLTLDHQLAGDARVIASGHPERRLAEHPVPANHHVLDRHGEGVADVQLARHVRRRHRQHERTLAAGLLVRARLE